VAIEAVLAYSEGRLDFGGDAMGFIYLLLISIVTFCAYGVDKSRARRGAWRIPEATLHTLALLGGTAGALAGMFFFRHKTRDRRFQAVLAAIVVLQILLFAAAIYLR
jgi:uncharacterized membrane protein YsdA (DUF1294 family)